jgi:hypothetical protein
MLLKSSPGAVVVFARVPQGFVVFLIQSHLKIRADFAILKYKHFGPFFFFFFFPSLLFGIGFKEPFILFYLLTPEGVE